MARYIHCTVRGRLGGVVRKHVGGKGFLYPGNSEELQRKATCISIHSGEGILPHCFLADGVADLILEERVEFKLPICQWIKLLETYLSSGFVFTKNIMY